MTDKVFVVILNWNGKADTLECLKSIKKITYPDFRIVVVDNGSTDDSVACIRAEFPDVDMVETHANLGFAGGNNVGIQYSLEQGADFLFILNNDTVVDPNILTGFVAAAKARPNGGIFGAKIYYYGEPNKLWYAGGYWDDKTLYFGEHGVGEEDLGQYDKLVETGWVIGCAMFVPAEVFGKVGLLEAEYFLNNEEIDFCSRVSRAGYSCMFVPDAKVWHKISASFGGEDSPLKTYFSARNRLLWAKRNAAKGLGRRIYAEAFGNLARRFLRPAISAMRGGPKAVWWAFNAAMRDPVNRAYFCGFRDFWLRRFGNCPDQIRLLNREWSARRSA